MSTGMQGLPCIHRIQDHFVTYDHLEKKVQDVLLDLQDMELIEKVSIWWFGVSKSHQNEFWFSVNYLYSINTLRTLPSQETLDHMKLPQAESNH